MQDCKYGSCISQYMMELTFSEAAKGANKQLRVNIDDVCPRCDGKGNEPGTKVSHCHYCNGTGMVSVQLLAAAKLTSHFNLFLSLQFHS